MMIGFQFAELANLKLAKSGWQIAWSATVMLAKVWLANGHLADVRLASSRLAKIRLSVTQVVDRGLEQLTLGGVD